MSDALLTALLLLAFGAQPLAPWRLAGAPPERRRPWVLGGLLLLASGTLAGILLLAHHADAALAQALAPWQASPFQPAMLVLLGAQLLALLLAAIAGSRLETSGWRILSFFGLLVLLASAFGAEVLRIGEGLSGPLAAVLALVLCRASIALGAGETLAPGRPFWGPLAALGLVAYPLLLPRPILHALLAAQGAYPFAAAILLFAASRWLPARLRRPALLAATLLAALGLTLAAHLTQGLSPLRVD